MAATGFAVLGDAHECLSFSGSFFVLVGLDKAEQLPLQDWSGHAYEARVLGAHGYTTLNGAFALAERWSGMASYASSQDRALAAPNSGA